MSRSLEMNAEAAESTSCSLEIIAETRRLLESSSLLPKRDLSLGFLLFSPYSPHRLPPWVIASGAPRHHVNPCITAAGTEAGPRALWGCAEGGREEGIPKLGCGELQAPRRAGPGGLRRNEEQVSPNLFQFGGNSPDCSLY